MTSTPTAWLFTLSTKARTTSSATSASSNARRTSRSAASTSASVNAPRRVKRSRMPPSLSESESNISCHVQASSLPGSTRQSILFASRWMPGSSPGMTRLANLPSLQYQTPTAPEGALRCRAVASGLQGRSAGFTSALGESARNLWMRPGEVKDAESCGAASCVPAAAYSPIRLPLLSMRELASCPPTMEGPPMQITRVLFIAFAAIGVSADRAWSQPSTADYPNREVNLVVPFAPGGGTDILGRLIGQKLSDRFGKPFVVENRPGAGTVTAAVQVAKSASDGYTIMMATSGTLAMNKTLYKKLPYEPGKDLVPVALVAYVPFVLVVNPDLPVRSVADLVRLAKERPLTYGSGGAGAFHHLMGELFKTTMGIQMTHVPYKGTIPAL